MLDIAWPPIRIVLWAALAAMLVLLVVRTIRRDRREYQRFKRYRTTARRQAMYRRWLRESFLSFGGLAVALLVIAGGYVGPLLESVDAWPPVRGLRAWLAENSAVAIGALVGVTVGFLLLTVVGILAARKEGEVMTVGDIRAMLPRNRQELRLGALLSLNAGVVEELVFRLGLPALLFGATGSALVAVLGSVLLFGALHLYQGPAGVIGTAIIGAMFMATFLLTGSILVPIVLHVLFDLRSIVLIPVTVSGVHRVDGAVRRSVPTPR